MQTGLRILLIDDEDLIRMTFRGFLEDFGCQVIEAGSGREGLEAFERAPADLVITDLSMPGMNGLEVVQVLAERYPGTPVIVVSGIGSVRDAVAAIRCGAWDFVTKPIQDERSLEVVLDRALDRANLLRENRRYHAELERLVAERTRELSESRSRYKRLLESVSSYVYTVKVVDGAAAGTEHGQGCEALTGYRPEDFAADPYLWYRMVVEADRSKVVQFVESIYTCSGARSLEHRIVCRDGSRRWVENTLVPLRDAEGRLLQYDGILKDVTERKEAEAALREHQAKIDLIVTSVNVGIWDWAIPEDRATFSSAFFQALGYGPGEVPGSHGRFLELVHPEDQAAFRAELDRCWESRQECATEFRIRAASGEYRWLLSRSKVVEWGPSGEPLRMVGTDTDITERKRSEERQQALEAQLRQAQKLEAVGQLAGGVAHDINNMISAMLGHLALVREQLPDDHPASRNLQSMEKAALRSGDIMRQLLAFSRRQPIEPEVLDLNAFIPEVQKGLLPLIREDIRVGFRPGAGLRPVRMDPTQVEQIVLNLVVNARDAMPQGGEVVLETSNVELDMAFCETHLMASPGPYVVVSVADTGCGMDPETLSRIFEPFFTTKGEGQGTGLGLSTVFGIVQQNHGFILVESTPGKGTRFQVHLPAFLGGDEQRRRDEASRITEGNGTILLVEDDEGLCSVLERLITRMGYQVLVAKSPLHAIELCRRPETRVDLLLTDVVMPEMGGRELTREVEALRPGVKILLMSGYTLDQLGPKGFEEGGHHLIPKPFSVGELSKRLASLLSEPA
jgi:PAS domain S-box-containing protein